MTSIAKLKDQARKHEQKEDWQAAIKAYQQVLEKEEGADDNELELGLFNRIGDLLLRLGQTDEAVNYYATAADKYAESGFLNNAIALCNKALRHRPDRPQIYLKLSGLCAEQGFETDARRWILEYAERQMKAGRVEEALAGLDDFADLSNDPEIRQTLAHQLAAHDRPDDAVEQLRRAYRLHMERGNEKAAAGVAERASAIDPSVDLAAEAPPEPLPGLGPEEPDEAPAGAEEEAAAGAGGIEGLETRTEELAAEEPAGVGGIEGLEPTVSEEAPVAPPEEVTDDLGGIETFDRGAPAAPEAEEEAAADEEEAEPLPLLDSSYDEAEDAAEDEDAVEDAEEGAPLPLIDTGLDELEDEEPEAVEAVEAVEEPEVVEPEPEPEVVEPEPEPEVVEPEPEIEEPEVVEPEPEPEVIEPEPEPEEPEEPEPEVEEAEPEELATLDFSAGSTGELASPTDPEEVAVHGPGEDAMDLDLGTFDLGVAGPGKADTEPEELDVEAVLDRGRELVSRGLMSEALRELQLLSAGDVGPESFRDALEIVNEVVRHDANDIGALQQRVDYSARTGDRDLLVDAYTDLADALARLGAETKAQAMYERVLGLDPGNEIAREALGEAAEGDDDTVDLDAVLREVEPEDLASATDGVESDPSFAAMLSQFKAKVTDKVEAGEAADHYDLGLAFKEMGLIDEAITEFQTALTGGAERLKVYEELGQCFMQKGQYTVALKVLNRALKVPHQDESELLGVYYHLGQCHEELGQRGEARSAYEKVLTIDGTFADVPDRVARL